MIRSWLGDKMPIKVNCWNEYDKLKTVILGNVYDIDRVPELYRGKDQESLQKIVEQTHEELANIKLILEQHDVNVLQPKQPIRYNESFEQTVKEHSPLINMRDFHMAYGKMFFLTYGSYRRRRYQHLWIEDIANQMILDGNLVLSANEPNIGNIDALRIPGESDLNRWKRLYLDELGNRNLYHTACMLKHNEIAFCSLLSGSKIGSKWIEGWLKTQGVEMVVANRFGHIDGNISILNKDVLLVAGGGNPVWQKHFKNIISCPMPTEAWEWRTDFSISSKVRNPTDWLYEFQGHFQQFNAEANALSLDPETVMLSFYDRDFFSMLKNKHGITGIYASWKNRHFWGGGLHCITCDIERYNDNQG